jgi:hypothetical protein
MLCRRSPATAPQIRRSRRTRNTRRAEMLSLRQNCPIEHGECKGLARPIVNEVNVGEGYLLSFEQMDLDRAPTAGQI